jgi:hypothetical protein
LPVLMDLRKVSNTPSPVVTTIGTKVTPADWKVPTIGTESSTYTFPFSNKCGAGPCQTGQGINWKQVEAVGVSAGLTIVGTGALVIQLPEVLLIPYGDVVYAAQVNAIAGGIRGTWAYETSPGPEGPSPQSAFAAFGRGEETGILGWILSNIP